MKVKVKMDYIAVKRITKAQIIATQKTAAKLRSEIIKDQVIPFRKGDLQNIFTDIDGRDAKRGKVTIYHDGPYAARLYYHPEYHFYTTMNKNAQGEWWKDYIDGSKKKFARQIFMYYYKKETGV